MADKQIERVIILSRWLMAPFYLGLILAAVVLLIHFGIELIHIVEVSFTASEADVILAILTLVDLTLTASLVFIVIFSGYENFVSRIDPAEHPGWPEWMSKIDFVGLKQKLMGSIVAISAVQLLKAYMDVGGGTNWIALGWLAAIHLVFVVSTLLLAIADRLSADH